MVRASLFRKNKAKERNRIMAKAKDKEKKISCTHPVKERLGCVGGQAVMEGVMMKHGNRYSLAVRKEDGTIEVSNHAHVSVRKKHKILNLPIIRGVVNMVEMFILSFGTLTMSAEAMGIEDSEPENKFEEWLLAKCGKWLFGVIMAIASVFGVVLSFLLFMWLPSLAAKGLQALFGVTFPTIAISLIEGVLKMGIFIAYLALVSLMKDIRRTFEYHGAEHKSIFCFEDGVELTPENVKKYTRFHPRCGTSFIFVVLIISILVGALPFIPTKIVWLRTLCKIALLPIVVGLGYEFIAFAGKHDNWFTRICSAPGLWVQRLTTKEPDLDQIAVAIAALKSAMPETFPNFPENGEAKIVTTHKTVKPEEVSAEQTEGASEDNADADAQADAQGTEAPISETDGGEGTPAQESAEQVPEETA